MNSCIQAININGSNPKGEITKQKYKNNSEVLAKKRKRRKSGGRGGGGRRKIYSNVCV